MTTASDVIANDERFWTKVSKTRGCWEWTGATNARGYGVYHVPGTKNKTTLAHRYVLGATAEAVMHTCDNPSCIRPSHLVAADRATNNRDAASKGRSRNASASITHCPQGHPYDTDNTYINPSGARACRECRRKQLRDSRARKVLA